MTYAYEQMYLSRISRAVGNMLHYAVLDNHYKGQQFLELFIQSGIAEQIENGSPKYLAGKSGLELFMDVLDSTGKKIDNIQSSELYDRSDVYWVGWAMTHYQWYSNRRFEDILKVVPYEDMLCQYKTLHEADIHKFYTVMDICFAESESKLKRVRERCNLTQLELSVGSGVSINTIRAYERKIKDINKAQMNIVKSLADTMKCNMEEIID